MAQEFFEQYEPTSRTCSCDRFGVAHIFGEGCDPDYDGDPKPFVVSGTAIYASATISMDDYAKREWPFPRVPECAAWL